MDNEFDEIINILEDIFGYCRHHNDYKGQISFDCPVCSYDIKGLDEGDGKGNLEVNYKQGVYKCWVCSQTHYTHGNILKLIRKYGNKKQYSNFLLYAPDEFVKTDRVYKKMELPKEFRDLNDVSDAFKATYQYKQVMNYLKTRNITDLMIQIHKIGFCYDGDYKFRVIIPSYDDEDELNYFVGRSYLPKPFNKYKNPEVDKENLIWNEHLINWDEPVYVVEGVFDSIFLPNSVPMLGKYMTQKLYNTLYDKAKKVIIVLDPDAREDQIKLFHNLNCGKLMGKVFVIELEGDQDIADLRGDLRNYKEKQLN